MVTPDPAAGGVSRRFVPELRRATAAGLRAAVTRAMPRAAAAGARGLLRRAGPAGLAAALLAYIGVALVAEPHAGRAGELALGAVTWLVLVAAARPLTAPERTRVAALVLVATAGEVLGSIVLGLYAYRRGGIPAFVPPGHGIVYLAGLQLSRSRLVRDRPRSVVRAAVAAGTGWALLGLVLGPRPDVAGALAMVAFLAFVVRGREPALFACMLLVVALLEFHGTWMGTWQWQPALPGLGLPMGNPPSGVAAGYCAFDALAIVLGPGLARLATRLRARLVRPVVLPLPV